MVSPRKYGAVWETLATGRNDRIHRLKPNPQLDESHRVCDMRVELKPPYVLPSSLQSVR